MRDNFGLTKKEKRKTYLEEKFNGRKENGKEGKKEIKGENKGGVTGDWEEKLIWDQIIWRKMKERKEGK